MRLLCACDTNFGVLKFLASFNQANASGFANFAFFIKLIISSFKFNSDLEL